MIEVLHCRVDEGEGKETHQMVSALPHASKRTCLHSGGFGEIATGDEGMENRIKP